MNRAAARDAERLAMALALEEAVLAEAGGDVPVGAIVLDAAGAVVGRGHNRREQDQDPTAHAELLALRTAAIARGRWRLDDCTLVVTLEPCPMCAGALVNARLGRLVFGARDPKAGAVASLFSLGTDPRLNHRFSVEGGLLETECSAVLARFFAARRRG